MIGTSGRFLACGLALAAVSVAAVPVQADEIKARTARLGWLDKVTAKVGESTVAVGDGDLDLGSLSIIVRACIRRVPPDDPESAAFLDITELTDGEAPKEVFRGWMFASSPALSAMEHGVYDVWVLECVIPKDEAAGESSTPEQPEGATESAPPTDGDAPLD